MHPPSSAISRSVFGAALLCAAAALGGCGPEAAVWLRVGAPLKVPDQCDELAVEARWDSAEGKSAFLQTYPLSASDRFPLTLSLTADDVGDSKALFVQATARKDLKTAPPDETGAPGGWATASGTVQLEKGHFVELELLMKAP